MNQVGLTVTTKSCLFYLKVLPRGLIRRNYSRIGVVKVKCDGCMKYERFALNLNICGRGNRDLVSLVVNFCFKV